jgi:hypothetical protein
MASCSLYAYLSAIDIIFSKDVDKYNSILDSCESRSITSKIQTLMKRVINSKGNLKYDELTTITLSFYEILITLEFNFAFRSPDVAQNNNNGDNFTDSRISYCEMWTKFDFPPFKINPIGADDIEKIGRVEKNHLMYTIFNNFLTNEITCSSYFVVTMEDRVRVFLPMNSKAESIAIEDFLHPYILGSN